MPSTDVERPSRHDRVWLDAATWRSKLRDAVPEGHLAFAGRWIEGGRALVGRRREPDAGADCFVGLASAPGLGRLRIPLIVDRTAVVRLAPPLGLGDVIAAAPRDRRPMLERLRREGEALGVTFGVYGSFAWQAIAGEDYVTPTSDLDLLWDATDRRRIEAVIALLSRWEAASGLRADGEARFANGDSIAWRELATAREDVLVKRDDGVALARSPIAAHA